MIKYRLLRWAGHVVRMEEGMGWFQNFNRYTRKGLQEGLGVDWRTILEWILKKQVSIRGIELIRIRTVIIREPF